MENKLTSKVGKTFIFGIFIFILGCNKFNMHEELPRIKQDYYSITKGFKMVGEMREGSKTTSASVSQEFFSGTADLDFHTLENRIIQLGYTTVSRHPWNPSFCASGAFVRYVSLYYTEGKKWRIIVGASVNANCPEKEPIM